MRHLKGKSIFRYKYLALLSSVLFLGITCVVHVHATDINNELKQNPLFLKKVAEHNSPLLIFHVDINLTITPYDTAGEKLTKEAGIMAILSERYSAKWDNTISEPITYKTYVKKLVKDFAKEKGLDSNSSEGKAFEVQKQGEFLDFLKKNDSMQAIYTQAQNDYNELNASKDFPTKDAPIFKSFLKLGDYLKERGYNYVILLRTFGKDGPKTQEYLAKRLGLQFINGAMEQGALKINDQTLSPEAFHNYIKGLKGTGTNLLVKEDYPHWDIKNNRAGKAGKTFPVDEDGNVCNMFFDDNIEPEHTSDETNIVNVINSTTGANINIADLKGMKGCNKAFKVDAKLAVLDDAYFIKLVRSVYKDF